MNELIKYFNKTYGKEYGNIAYPRNSIEMYQVYQIIKDLNLEDENLERLLDESILPKPKTLKEREMYSECINNPFTISNPNEANDVIKIAPIIKNGNICEVSINELHEVGNGYYMLPYKEDETRPFGIYFKLFLPGTNTTAKSALASGYGSTPFRVIKDNAVEGKGTIYLDNIYYEYQIGITKEECIFKSYPYFLICNNNKEYTPTNDYHPSTKKYVDDKFSEIDIPQTDLSDYATTDYVNTQLKEIANQFTTEQTSTQIKLKYNNVVILTIPINNTSGGSGDTTPPTNYDDVGNISSNNVISLTGLQNGTYTLKYEDDNGVLSSFGDIGIVEVNN